MCENSFVSYKLFAFELQVIFTKLGNKFFPYALTSSYEVVEWGLVTMCRVEVHLSHALPKFVNFILCKELFVGNNLILLG